MLRQRLGQYLNATNQRRDNIMPMGKGTYGTTKGRPPAKKMTGKQKTLPPALQKKIMKKKK
jgi:hypothetical protein